MATKSAAKKTTKKPVAKRPVSKAAPRPARAVKVTTHKVAPVRSFRRSKPEDSFFTFRPTIQTVYWIILAFVVLMLGVWVTMINVKVQRIYDQIDDNNSYLYTLPDATTKKP